MRTIFRNIFLLVAVISALLLTACGGGGGGGGKNPAAPTQTGTLKGTVSLPTASIRVSLDKSASNTVSIASDTALNNQALRANQSQSLEGTKVWLEGYPEIEATTDKDGNYILPNVPFGENRVVANIKIGNEEFKWRSEVQKVENTTIIIVPQIVMIPAKTSISGIVYDAVSQKAIQGVIVEVWGQRSTSGKDGKYTVFNMPAGSWDVTYSKNGYQTFTTPMSFADGVETSGNFYLVPEGTSDPNIASNSGSVALTELIPAYKAEFVSNQTTISAFFNGAVINTNYAKIKFTSGNPKKVGGSFSFENDRVIYTHNEEWPANTKIAGSISDLRDYFGKTIASIPFEFTTTANIVNSISPENNATKVEVDTPIVITFNTKMDTTKNLLDLIKITDNSNGSSYAPPASTTSNLNNNDFNTSNSSITLSNKNFNWNISNSKYDVLTIKDIQLQPNKTYTVLLSENLLDKNGNKLQGTRDFSFSTRGAVYINFDTPNTYHHSDLKFLICGDGTITDVSKASISFSENVSGKLSVKGDYITFKLNDGQSWTVGNTVNGKLSGLTDKYGVPVDECGFEFYVNYFEGAGTEEDPYLITNADDLNNVRFVQIGYFKQTQDIDLSAYGENYEYEDDFGYRKGWNSIGGIDNNPNNPWCGNYDGNGKKITGLCLKGSEGGIFATVQFTIKNLGVQIDAENYFSDCGGIIAKTIRDGGSLENCWVSGSGKISGNNCGVLVYSLYNHSKMINCFSDLEIVGSDIEVGGLVAVIEDNCVIENCYSKGKVSGFGNVGGLVGSCYKSTIRNSFSKSDILKLPGDGPSGNNIGGLVGLLDRTTIGNCYYQGNINDVSDLDDGCPSYIGGLVGLTYSKASIYNCYAGSSTIESKTGPMVRVINGSTDTTITNCYANKNMKLIKNGVTSQPGLQNPLPSTVALDGINGANLPDNPDWKNKIFKDGYENGDSFDSIWEIGTSGLPILKNMPGNPAQ